MVQFEQKMTSGIWGTKEAGVTALNPLVLLRWSFLGCTCGADLVQSVVTWLHLALGRPGLPCSHTHRLGGALIYCVQGAIPGGGRGDMW